MANKILIENGEGKKIKKLLNTTYPTIQVALEGKVTTALHAKIRKLALDRGGVEVVKAAPERVYQLIDDTLTITVNDWIKAGLTENQLWKDSKANLLSIFRRGINGNTLIDVKSIKRPERLRVIESAYGRI